MKPIKYIFHTLALAAHQQTHYSYVSWRLLPYAPSHVAHQCALVAVAARQICNACYLELTLCHNSRGNLPCFSVCPTHAHIAALNLLLQGVKPSLGIALHGLRGRWMACPFSYVFINWGLFFNCKTKRKKKG